MFRVIDSIKKYNAIIDELANDSIGFVPTMGNLHQGHLKLLETSLKENDISVISIFVNPTQFGQGEDFNEYPRTREADISKIESLYNQFQGKEMIVFIPNDSYEIYEQGIECNYHKIELHSQLEGHLRPTHFKGVEEVVEILLRIVHPATAYFGKKDFQQFILIKKLVERLKLNIKIKGIDIVRESSGLAMSSRNQYLSEIQMTEALIISKTLRSFKNTYEKNKDLEALKNQINLVKDQFPNFNYLEIKNAKDLSSSFDNESHLVILANYKMNKINLLDNIELNQ